MASTYPADVAEAAKWSRANSDKKGDDAVKLVESQPWDPSVQSLVAFPQVIIMMGEKPDWVQDLGDAFLAQPEDVMDSVQRLRAQAQKAGNLKHQFRGQGHDRDRDQGADRRAGAGDRGRAGAAAGGLRSDRTTRRVGLRHVAVSRVSAVLHSAAAGLLVLGGRGHRHRVGRGHRHQQRAVGQLQLGPRRRERQRQPLQQHQLEQSHQRQRQRRTGTTIRRTAATPRTGAAMRRGRTSIARPRRDRASSIAAATPSARGRPQSMQNRGMDVDRSALRAARRVAERAAGDRGQNISATPPATVRRPPTAMRCARTPNR